MREHRIEKVEAGGISDKAGLAPGDILLSINGSEIGDVFDYRFLINDEALTLRVRKADGTEREVAIEKEYNEDLGISFENGLMDDYHSCNNKCIFCFIDQMPPGMRETLYFKDDDSRLSFLQGNYVTLTNMGEEEIERIITYHMEPINVSIHTTNPRLRCEMLKNRFAGESLEKLRRFYEAGIEMNAQIVLCKGINDGEELEKTIRDLAGYLPHMKSVSVVPAGLTKFRKGLYPLKPFTGEDATILLDAIHGWQETFLKEHDTHFVHASDEWYLLAGRFFPPEETYDGYPQLENGVGMITLLQREFEDCLQAEQDDPATKKRERKRLQKGRKGIFARRFPPLEEPKPREKTVVSVATGMLAAPLLRKLAAEYTCFHPEADIRVYGIKNEFFGEMITVSGLLCGQDLKRQLQRKELGEKLFLPCNLLKSGGDVFLDDVKLSELENALQVPVHIVKSDGQSLFDALDASIRSNDCEVSDE